MTRNDNFIINNENDLLKNSLSFGKNSSIQSSIKPDPKEIHKNSQNSELNYKNHKKIFNPKNKTPLTNRIGSNQEPEHDPNLRISRGKKRTVIKCQESQIPLNIPTTNREYLNNKSEMKLHQQETDSLSTVCQSND